MRRCLALDLKDDAELIARYEAWHRPGAVPEPVVASIRAAGILEMEIWRVQDRLFMLIEAGPDFSPQAKAAADMDSRDVRAWERLMSAFQKPLPGSASDEKWRDMRRIFALSEQP